MDENISHFRRISVPLVRRIYPSLIAEAVVSVQPLLTPTTLEVYVRQVEQAVIEARNRKSRYVLPAKVNWQREGF